MNTKYLCILFFLLNSFACKKFLETKSAQRLATPDNLNDLQLLLDNPILQVGLNAINTGTDEYNVLYSNWQSLSDNNKRAYVWDPELNNSNDWSGPYKGVFYANTVLFNLERIRGGDDITRNNIRGAALFTRGFLFYFIAQQFAPQYDEATAGTDLGIVLRLNADFNEVSVRSTVKQTYQQIINDLEAAVKLLPEDQLLKSRPGKAAALAMLARVYLQTGDFKKAGENADACLKINNKLIDYNSLALTATFPLGLFSKNDEMLFYFKASTEVPVSGDETRARVDSNLYRSYDPNDLRKKAFFKDNGNGTFAFKGSYTGEKTLFNGIATDEVYLIRAECNARMNNAVAAMEDLNALLQKRWASGKYAVLSNLSPDQVLQVTLQERKKELLCRGIRWSDLKRLNKDNRFAMTLKRELNGQVYLLPPNDLRYTVLIPTDIIFLTGIPQNPR
ncbi:SusD family protein [Chitinophaga niabensis]|uniref:SusD family protein n=2 Tax=Chitinophaga niabensis TaxID=536979 RepID=A0A1N6G6S2_9BACT|nr:SusD family protein [Chitinophaga niabensis]